MSIESAIDSQITYIGSQDDKAREIATNLSKQYEEINSKRTQLLEGSQQARDYYKEIFDSLRKVIDEAEGKLLADVDSYEQGIHSQFDKKMESMKEQEQAISDLHSLMNLEITNNFEFLKGSGERNKVIEKAVKPANAIKYPAPIVKGRQERIVDDIIKEMKAKPKQKRKESVQSKPVTQTQPSKPSNAAPKVNTKEPNVAKTDKKADPQESKPEKPAKEPVSTAQSTKPKPEPADAPESTPKAKEKLTKKSTSTAGPTTKQKELEISSKSSEPETLDSHSKSMKVKNSDQKFMTQSFKNKIAANESKEESKYEPKKGTKRY